MGAFRVPVLGYPQEFSWGSDWRGLENHSDLGVQVVGLELESNQRPQHYRGGHENSAGSRCIPLGAIFAAQGCRRIRKRGAKRDTTGPTGTEFRDRVGTDLLPSASNAAVDSAELLTPLFNHFDPSQQRAEPLQFRPGVTRPRERRRDLQGAAVQAGLDALRRDGWWLENPAARYRSWVGNVIAHVEAEHLNVR